VVICTNLLKHAKCVYMTKLPGKKDCMYPRTVRIFCFPYNHLHCVMGSLRGQKKFQFQLLHFYIGNRFWHDIPLHCNFPSRYRLHLPFLDYRCWVLQCNLMLLGHGTIFVMPTSNHYWSNMVLFDKTKLSSRSLVFLSTFISDVIL